MSSPTAPSSFLRYVSPGEAAALICGTRKDVWALIRARALRWRFDPAGRYRYLVAKTDAKAPYKAWDARPKSQGFSLEARRAHFAATREAFWGPERTAIMDGNGP